MQTGRKGPSGPGPSGGFARWTNQLPPMPDSSPGSGDSTSSRLIQPERPLGDHPGLVVHPLHRRTRLDCASKSFKIDVFHRSYVSKNALRSSPKRSASRRSCLNQRAAVVRSRAVSKISLNRRRTRDNSFSFGIFSNRFSYACRSSGVQPSGSRRKAHICERNAFRSALFNFAFYLRVIFSWCSPVGARQEEGCTR